MSALRELGALPTQAGAHPPEGQGTDGEMDMKDS